MMTIYSSQRTQQQGFTLIELMVVVAIVAILAALALPSYRESVMRGKRSDAQAALVGLSQQMERIFSQNASYAGAITGTAPQPPDIFPSTVPIDGGAANYNLTIEAVTGNSYTLRATPVGGQVGDGYLELLSTGIKRWNEKDTTLKNCWDGSC